MDLFSDYGEFQQPPEESAAGANKTNAASNTTNAACTNLSLNRLKWLCCCQTIKCLFEIHLYLFKKYCFVMHINILKK